MRESAVCELFCLSSRLPTRAAFSLDIFARSGTPGEGAIDGWGVASYEGRDIRLYKEPKPANDKAWVTFVQQRRLATQLLITHIRRGTTGARSHADTQPFARELGGRMHVFAHHGRLDGIAARHAAAPRRFRPIGDTDSEFAFCILMERLSALWCSAPVPTLGRRLDVVARFAAELRGLGPASFLYADGTAVFAHGHRRAHADRITTTMPDLWLLQRDCTPDIDGLPDAGVTLEPARDQIVTMLASAPLTNEDWRPLDEGEVVVVKDGRVVSRSVDEPEYGRKPPMSAVPCSDAR